MLGRTKLAAGSLADLMATQRSVADRPSRRETAVPAVVAVVVTDGTGDVGPTLTALAAQDYPGLTVLVLDRSGPIERDELRARIAAAAPTALIRTLERRLDAVAAANDVLVSVEGAPFVCFVAPDVEPEPSAVRLLVEEAFRSNAGICGPKFVDAAQPELLVEVGPAIDHYGVVFSGVDPGERDQEQHDAVRDTFFVSMATMLVRTDLLHDLGGFDPKCAPGHEDIDLCWRAHIAGARVMVVPDARVRRSRDGAERFGAVASERAVAVERRMRMVLKNYSLGALVWILPIAAVLNAVEGIGYLATRRFGLARSTVAGFWTAVAHSRRTTEARAAVQALRKVDDRDVRAYMVRGSSRVRHFVAHRRIQSALVETAEGRIRAQWNVVRTAFRSLDTWVAASMIALLVVGVRSFVSAGVPSTGGFQRWTSTGDLLGAWGGSWRATGLGAADPGTPLSGLAGLWSALWLGNAQFAQMLAVVGAIPTGLVGVYRLTRRLSPRALPAAGAVLAYGANPVLRNAFAETRFDALVTFALAPYVLARAIVLIDGATGSPRRRSLAGIVLLVAIGAAVSPAFALFPAVIALAVAMTWPIVGGLWSTARAVFIAGVTLAGAFALLAPWSFRALGQAESMGFVPREHPALVDSFAFRTGTAGAGPWVWCIFIAALLPLLVATEGRFAWALRGWTMAVVSFAIVVLSGGTSTTATPALEVLLVPAALGLALAIAIGLAAFFGDIRTFVFGPRQGLALGLAATAALPFIGVLPDVFDGGFDAPSESWGETLAFFDDVAIDDGPFRVAWVGRAEALPVDAQIRDGDVAYAVTRNGAGDLRDLLPPVPDRPEETLTRAFDEARAGRTVRLGHALAPMGVRYVAIVDRSAPNAAIRHEFDASLAANLDRQLDLTLARRVDGIALYENGAWLSPRAVLVGELPAAASQTLDARGGVEVATRTDLAEDSRSVRGRDADLELAQAGRFHLAERFDDRWRLTVDGETADHVVSLGWANGFDVGAGSATLDRSAGALGVVRLAVAMVLWALVAALALFRRRGDVVVRALAVDFAPTAPTAPRRTSARRRARANAAAPAGTTMQGDSDEVDDLAALAAIADAPVVDDQVDWSVLSPDRDASGLDELDEVDS